MKIKMELLSDTIFGNGMTEKGGIDRSVLTDENGFPYYKGSTFKGVFRESLEQLLDWTIEKEEAAGKVSHLLGAAGDDSIRTDKLMFSDLVLSEAVRKTVLDELGNEPDFRQTVTDITTNIRSFTSINDEGTAQAGSLRTVRCVNSGLIFYGTIECPKEEEKLVNEVLGMIKWIGTMRNRGFGKVRFSVDNGREE